MIITLIGSGVMSAGICQVLVSANISVQVNIVARSIEKGEALKSQVIKQLRRLVSKGKLEQVDADKAAESIHLYDTYEACKNSDIVIEAISEDFTAKLELFGQLAEHIGKDTIVATNTSSLPITAFASVLPNPNNVIGLHFFNPAPLMELVEIVSGHETDAELVTKMCEFTQSLGKKPVIVNEAPGFVVNRMLIPMINEAVCILAEGVATAEDIDKAMKYGAHHPMGPLALADLIGNDVNLSIMDTLYKETGDPKYRAHPLLRKMVRANYLGRKTKQGFYKY
ncbi:MULTISPECIES: 3-hydroxyacyl-CoA dehydrogenase family protein [Pseudoalteromonas]|uniref:3-hydroxyacyl-CoA dehydrogenase NAD-binding domain-containing protein n=1 Tax=Pseudoalteromonas obscura TaxID=3048491 RepID=A0ABT7ERC1_9GAMM|nr:MULTISPECIES: 3-hydroxyacyl-CoA dehydrogenase NAD-binding domain-containing protein [Pseudoalteromonas]MBQ4838301.1 3-hydroxybutyryl-CoA dehydrogenase [Pseudoalteromonas luteoviolacea]MDK2597615.1 3-hydroxyacyl-CoA dehydrogenase NAD-binding domain-containing protein [Pseudoalteromonas sp. P94(2023)]